LSTYYYDLSNLYSSLGKLKNPDPRENWNFDDALIKKEIFNLRKSISVEGFNSIKKERQCQIYTNLGNTLNKIGRGVKAQEEWSNSLSIIPHFPMALGNKSNGLISYSERLLKKEQKLITINIAYKHIQAALALKEFLEPRAENFFNSIRSYLESNYHPDLLKKQIKFDKRLFKINISKAAVYRFWINKNRLLLSPLNDITSNGNFYYDDLLLPPILMPAGSKPIYHILFNQIKQEFCSARYNLFQYSKHKKNHFSDKNVVLVEYSKLFSYSYRIELIKSTFKTFYSIFDKIAYLINDYLSLNRKRFDVSFRKIWYTNYQKAELDPMFNSKVNWSMRALFWVSKDLFDDEMKDTIEPESQHINQLRNYIEHKGIMVSRIPFNEKVDNTAFNYAIGSIDLELKTYKIAKLVREAMLYLCFSVSQIEREFNPNNLQFSSDEYPEINEK